MFFPLMKTPHLEGILDLLNDSPNNWEKPFKRTAHIYSLQIESNKWKTNKLFELNKGEYRRVYSGEFIDEMALTNLLIIYPSATELPSVLESLPKDKFWYSEVPAWRNTSGFINKDAQVSYQADVEPLPKSASMLTFHPFIQFTEIKNYLVVLNLIANPIIEKSDLYIFNSSDCELRGKESIYSNSVTTIELDKYRFKPTDLPVFYSPQLAGIPFGLGISNDQKMLSLEHTHPPASFVLFGDRRKSQAIIKKRWIERLNQVINA